MTGSAFSGAGQVPMQRGGLITVLEREMNLPWELHDNSMHPLVGSKANHTI